MPEQDQHQQQGRPAARLEDHWRERFERSAALETDADRNIGRDYGHRVRRAVFLEMVEKHLPTGATSVLDIGCGSGTYFDIYDKLGLRIHGLDFSAAQLAQARKRYPSADLIEGELAAAPADLRVDLIVCIGVVQVVSNLEQFVADIAAHLNPHGRVIISCLNKVSVWPGRMLDPHLHFYSRGDMLRLFAPHFDVVAWKRFYPIPPPLAWMTPVLHRLQLPLLNHGLMFVLQPRSES